MSVTLTLKPADPCHVRSAGAVIEELGAVGATGAAGGAAGAEQAPFVHVPEAQYVPVTLQFWLDVPPQLFVQVCVPEEVVPQLTLEAKTEHAPQVELVTVHVVVCGPQP